MKKYYTDERNVQILISLLKANNIKKVIASPGTCNLSFVGSIQNDPFFEVYSCVDERSACYMACGMSTESGEPVVLSCTGATASRNYVPGLTEAYYRKLPILAVTSALHKVNLHNNIPQSIDRTQQLKDMVKLSVQIPAINSKKDEDYCNIEINRALLELKHRGGGPVHINLEITHSVKFEVKNLPTTRKITRILYNDDFPDLKDGKVGIFIGNHKKINKELREEIDEFCENYNVVVLCDHSSNYNGKYKILGNIVCNQDFYNTKLNEFDLLIHIGDVSGAYMDIRTKEVWRVNPDGEIRDTFLKLKYVFEIEEIDFFKKYNNMAKSNKCTEFYKLWKKEFDEIERKALSYEIPFSNIWIARNTIKKLPQKSTLYLGILNSLRSWNFFNTDKEINVYSNTGGFGIDGMLSSLIGASLTNKEKLYFGVIGDLGFFYDINALGNRNVGNNIRLLLINNGCGTEFHNYSHPGFLFGEDANSYIAADGHFGNKSKELVKHYAQDLGFEYISAENKKEFLKNVDYFTSSDKYNKPIIFEIFTNSKDESDALKIINNLKTTFGDTAKTKVKKVLSPKLRKK